jgi:RNA polymerase sigma-70 factor (TIGR02957 family)
MSMDDLYSYRPLMFTIAYQMTGSVGDAEDIVQEAFLRASGHQPRDPRAYLATVTTRLAIDYLRSARVRREAYVGTWLPEPILNDEAGPAEQAELSDSLSMAFLVLLESLNPAERAVFLLREVFGYDYAEIAQATGKSQPNCRQIFARAKRQVEERRPRFEASRAEADELVRRFRDAATGDVAALNDLLAPDVVFVGDSGGRGEAALEPLYGRDQVLVFLAQVAERSLRNGAMLEMAQINGQPGLVVRDAARDLVGVLAFDVLDGEIQAIRSVVNPDKLRHLGPVSSTWHGGQD